MKRMIMEEITKEIYKDALQPTIRPCGEILGFFPRTIKLALSKWEKWLINGEENLRLVAEAIRDKVKQIPEEKLVEPEPYVAIPAMQQLCYCQNSEELRDLYANLLTASMNIDTKWKVHPSFVDVIKQLNPDEAKYIKHLPPMIVVSHPIIDVNFSIGGNGEHNIISNFTNYNINVLEHPNNICAYIDNLIRLNIIVIPAGVHLADLERYKALEQHPFVINSSKVGNAEAIIEYHYHRKVFKLTNYGINFLDSVCK